MKKFKSILCLLLALVMVLGLAACGPKDSADDDKKEDDTKVEDNKTDDKKEDDKTEEVDPYAEPVTIKVIGQNFELAGKTEIEAALKAYVKEKINVDLEYIWIDQNMLTEKENAMFAVGGDSWDLATTTSVVFKTFAEGGAFLALEDYVDEYIPAMNEWITDEVQAAATINGHLYGIIPYKDLGSWWYIRYNENMVADLGLTDKIPATGWETMWDWVDFYKEAKKAQVAKYPDKADTILVTAVNDTMDAWFNIDPLIGSMNSTLICTNIEGRTGFASITDANEVFCPYYTEDFVKWAKQLKEFSDLKISKGGKWTDTDPTWGGGGQITQASIGSFVLDKNQYIDKGFTQDISVQKGTMYTAGITGACMAINAETENPERVCALVNLLYDDEYILNLMHFGIEGADKDWTDADNDGVIEWGARNQDSSKMYWKAWYGIRNILNLGKGKVLAGLPADFGAQLKATNDACDLSQNMGFSMSTEPVATEVAACTAVVSEYMSRITSCAGETDIDQLCKDFVDKLKANGMDKIIAEGQSQLDAWRTANGK